MKYTGGHKNDFNVQAYVGLERHVDPGEAEEALGPLPGPGAEHRRLGR